MTVIHPWLTLYHGVLIGAKKRKPIGNEILQNLECLLTRDREPKLIKFAKMISTISPHEV